MKTKAEIPANNVRAIRKARGLTLEQVATELDTDIKTIQRLETGGQRLTDKWIGPLGRVLDVAPAELISGEAPAIAPFAANVRPADVPVPVIASLPTDVPVLGTVAGSHAHGAFQFEGGVIDYVRRPPAMMGAKNLYALYVEGTSMVPEHNPGDLRFVHPDRPPRIGDSVIVETQIDRNSGKAGMIGRLIARTATVVRIGKLNPEATVELKRETVVTIHKVLTLNELFGV